MSIIAWLVVGAIAGYLAGYLVKGDEGMGVIGHIVLGIVGALIGGAGYALTFGVVALLPLLAVPLVPVEAALRWQESGAEWIHLVDLDAAFGRGSNAPLLARVVGQHLDAREAGDGGC